MGETIAAIKARFAQAELSELDALIKHYEQDGRAGVQALCKNAVKRKEAFAAEQLRTAKMSIYEQKYADFAYICGIDEAGRGPLAGPVVAGAVILPKTHVIYGLDDSKKLSAKKREALYEIIMKEALAVGIGYASHERIDEINILQATYEAMQEAVRKLPVQPTVLLNDAVRIPKIDIRQVPIVHGDARSVSIAAASIVAKVTRDRLMTAYDDLYPGYGFASNKGYGSAGHIAALKELGPSPIHRRTFIGNFLH